MAIGGSIEAVTIDGREFAVTADADVTRKLGGFEGEDQPNGNGSVRNIMTRVAWSLDGIVLECDDDKGDHEYLQEKADSPDPYAIAITYASGITYQGVGKVSGELGSGSMSASIPVKLGGGGKLTKQ